MTSERSGILHRVTVEFISNRPPAVYDLDSAEEAHRCVETAKQDSEAWHVFYATHKGPRATQHLIQLSLYRSYETREWRRQHQVFD